MEKKKANKKNVPKIDLNKIKYTFTEGEKEGLKVCIGYNMNKEKEIIDILES